MRPLAIANGIFTILLGEEGGQRFVKQI